MAELKLRRERDGSSLTLVDELHRGGEGTIYSVCEDKALVVKIYRQMTTSHSEKLRVMVANPPTDPARAPEHVSFAWPKTIAFLTSMVLASASRCPISHRRAVPHSTRCLIPRPAGA